MATFLQLCEQLHTESGIAGNPPSSVTGQLGDNKRIVNNIKQAWLEIQLKRNDWLFMQADFLVEVPTNTQIFGKTLLDAYGVTDASRFRHFMRNEITAYPASVGRSGEYDLHFMHYQQFRKEYETGVEIQATPECFSLNRTNDMVLDYKTPEPTMIRGVFAKTPQVLATGSDEPDMPDYFHNLIVYEALVRYGFYEAASEQYEFAKERLMALENQLLIEQTAEVIM